MSAAVAAAASAAAHANRRNSARITTTTARRTNYTPNNYHHPFSPSPPCHSRYENNKRQDWNKFVHYLKNYHHAGHGQPPLSVRRCSGSHVLGFLKYLDQFGGTKVHTMSCEYYGQAYSCVACSCPLKEAWSSLEGVVGRLRVAFEEYGGSPVTNPFGSPVVRLYLKEVKVCQAKARGLSYGC